MRKRTFNFIVDKIFWYIIYFLPVLAWLISLINNTPVDFATFLSNVGFDFVNSSILVTVLNDLFGVSGVLPIFTSTTPLLMLSWFMAMVIIHLAVDTLIFIPRLCHKFMDTFTRDKE